jgi:hypothetical protein
MDEQNKATEEKTETVTADKAQGSPQDLTDQKLEEVSGGGGFVLDVVAHLVGEAIVWGAEALYDAAKNNTEPYPDGTRTDIMGNQG